MDGRGKLSVRTARDGDRVLVEIGDNGLGIPEPVAAHGLEPFYTTKPVGKGTGPGLDICWRIRRPAPPRRPALHLHPGRHPLPGAAAAHPERVMPGPRAQTGSRRSPPWAAMAQITKTSRVMRSSDQNG
jgi:hypothetical protein